jgi:membrane glycosyltransferase
MAPPVQRTPMAPVDWPAPLRGSSKARPRRAASPSADEAARERRLRRTARLRRTIFTALALAQTGAFTYYLLGVLPYHGQEPLELAIVTLFTVLFAWVSLGFWTAVSGFVLVCFGRDRHAITRSVAKDTPIAADARTAIIMPICNEHVARVFAGLRATYESVARAGALPHFDFFVLSDTNEPDTLVAERRAWLDVCAAVDGFGHIFYRWRRHRVKRKTGNVADFCRRWGSRYRYMVVLDADSVMSGECLTTLVRLMEANPTSGIIQTAPRSAGRETLYARIQQFAGRVYGPLYTAGLHFWQLDESYYWGHNAIIRIAPFMRHCALGRLPGRGPLSGEILSHDFVEAALMRRAGWKVWMAYDLPGSYEEMPPNLLDELKRDRRWCRGNLINSRMLIWAGLHPAHRALFVTGIMAYVSAPLWLISLGLASVFAVLHVVTVPEYFVQPRQLFPIWPEWNAHATLMFAIGTCGVLFLPKILGGALVVRREADRFGGAAAVASSVLLELLFASALAPVRMLFHTQFVIASLAHLRILWKSPPREDAETSWREAARRHGVHALLGLTWTIAVYWLAPSYTWWLLPITGALVIAMPLSVYSSRVSLGRAARRARLFLIPEEADPPRELQTVRTHAEDTDTMLRFIDVVVDSDLNAIACAAIPRDYRDSGRMHARRARTVAMALEHGPDGLTEAQKRRVLSDPFILSQLHREVTASPAAHPGWRVARSRETVGESARFAAAS